jgi:hypothetical protein
MTTRLPERDEVLNAIREAAKNLGRVGGSNRFCAIRSVIEMETDNNRIHGTANRRP